jgi:hypothetical protein
VNTKTLKAIGWFHPYENTYTLEDGGNIINAKPSGHSISDAVRVAQELGYTHVLVDNCYKKPYTIQVGIQEELYDNG